MRFYWYFCQRCDIYEENTYHIMRQVIKLTESDINNIVRQVINEALNEMDKDVALYPTTIYKATDRMVTNGQYSAINKCFSIFV